MNPARETTSCARNPRRAAWPLALVLGMLGAAGAPAAQEGPDDEDPVAKARRALRQPGPEARLDRERAVDTLFRMTSREAHEVLRDAVLAGPDPDGVCRFVLDTLARRWSQIDDPAFGSGDEARRTALFAIHAPAVVRAASWTGDDEADAEAAAVRRSALTALRALDGATRLELFRGLFSSDDAGLVRAAAHAAARCRDRSLARPLAALLGDPRHADAAREALATLTFAEPFADLAAYEAWAARTADSSYVELAERAARAAKARTAALIEDYDDRLRNKVVRLIVAMLRAGAVDWRAVQEELLADDPPGLLLAGLVEMRRELAEAVTRRKNLGGLVPDRLALAAALDEHMASGDLPVADVAVHLEVVAYLRAVSDGEERTAIRDRLRAELAADDPVLQRAALRGLRAYPEPATRNEIVRVARRAAGRAVEQRLPPEAPLWQVVAEALRTLSTAGQVAPGEKDPGRADWRGLLGTVLSAPQAPVELKNAATDLAILKDPDGERTPDGFELLREAIAEPAQPALFRQQAMIRWRMFTDDPAAAEVYVETLCALLADDDALVRAAAAEQLRRVPEGSAQQRTDWSRAILVAAAPRVLVETDRTALEETVGCMRKAAEPPVGDTAAAVGRFRKLGRDLVAAADDPAAAPERAEDPLADLRRRLVVESLQLLGASPGRDRAVWLAAAEALAELGASAELWSVLERNTAVQLLDQEPAGDAVRVARLLVEAARLAPADAPWTARREQASQVLRAVAELEEAGRWEPTAADRRLRIELLAALSRDEEVVRRGTAALEAQDVRLEAADRAAVARHIVESHLRTKQWGAAEELTRTVQIPGTDELLLTAAEGWLASGDAARSLELADEILAGTPEDAALWGRAFLLRQEAAFTVAPEERSTVLRQLESHRARFEAEEAAPELAERFRSLLDRIRQAG